MDRNTQHSLWHRCGTCGALVNSMRELHAHLEIHQTVTSHIPYGDLRQPINLVEDGIVKQEQITVWHHGR